MLKPHLNMNVIKCIIKCQSTWCKTSIMHILSNIFKKKKVNLHFDSVLKDTLCQKRRYMR